MTREVKTRVSPVIISNETFLAYLHRFIAIMMDALMIMIILKSHLKFQVFNLFHSAFLMTFDI